MDLLGRKVYSLARLLFRITNYQVVLAKYDFNNYTRLAEFQDKLPAAQRQQFQALVDKGCLVAKEGLELAVDVADMSSHTLAAGVIRH